MQVKFAVNDECTLEIDVRDVRHAFEFIAYAQSVFSVPCCGNCESRDLRLDHRQPQGYDYYSVVCDGCGFELKFGQQKETGRLFPKGWEAPFVDDGTAGTAQAPAQAPAEPAQAPAQAPAEPAQAPAQAPAEPVVADATF